MNYDTFFNQTETIHLYLIFLQQDEDVINSFHNVN